MQRLLTIIFTKVRTQLQVHNLPMATIKNNWFIASITAILLLFGVFFVVNAMDKEVIMSQDNTVVETTWYFIGDNLSDATTASPENWTTVDPELGCGTGSDLPCAMTVENAGDYSSLQQFLNGKTAVDIRDIHADSKRAE